MKKGNNGRERGGGGGWVKIECLSNEDLNDWRLFLTYHNHFYFKGLLKRLLLLLFLTTNTFHQHQEFWSGFSQTTNGLPVYAPRRNHRKANQKMNPTWHQSVIFWWMFLISQCQTLRTYLEKKELINCSIS